MQKAAAVPGVGKWVELVDSDTGMTYFWNPQTNATRWTLPGSSSSSSTSKRKKKRRKRKTPKTSSSRGRPHRRLWQLHVPGWSWCCSSRCVPVAGFAGYDAHRAVSSFVALADEARGDSTGAVLVQGYMPVVIASGAFDQTAQKTVEIPQLPFLDKLFQCSGVVQRPIPMVVFRPEMLVHHGRHGPQGIFAPFFHVVHMPVVCNDRCLWCLRQCRRSSRTCCPCPCCATTRAHGARDSAGAVHSSICGAHRDDLRRQTACSAAPWCMVRQCRILRWCRSCSSSEVVGLPSCRRGKSPWSCLFR